MQRGCMIKYRDGLQFAVGDINLTIKVLKLMQVIRSMLRQESQPSSLYSSKSSIHPRGRPQTLQQSSQFSFNKGQYDSNKALSIREDLTKLCKEDLIEIVMEEVEESKMLRIQLATLQEQCKIIGSFRDDSVSMDNSEQFVPMAKYKELADYMEEYIGNTNEAQNYFSILIHDLKAQNSRLKQQNKHIKNEYNNNHKLLTKHKDPQNEQHKQTIMELQQTIRNLEDSVTHYISINNEHTRKYERLKKMYDTLEGQLATALDSFHEDKSVGEALLECNKENMDRRKCDKDDPQLKERVKLLEIQNGQLKEACAAMQKALQAKSDKIRKLLQQMQRLSEQKWIYKQKYLQIKSKSCALTQSSSKNSAFDSCVHHDVNVDEYGSLKG